jgi:hypothetical protein
VAVVVLVVAVASAAVLAALVVVAVASAAVPVAAVRPAVGRREAVVAFPVGARRSGGPGVGVAISKSSSRRS